MLDDFMNIDITYLYLKTYKRITSQANRLRGYIGNEFKEYPILHNHYTKEDILYSYPLVQYHIIDGEACIVAIEEGGNVIKNITSNIEKLELDKTYDIKEKILVEKSFDIKPTSEEHHYKFITPWIGLNSENYNAFLKMKDWKDKKILLNKILVGNILSLSKGLGIIVNKRLYAKSHLESTKIKFKSVYMNGFIGEFKIHYKIPYLIGLGKGVSHGFGAVEEINDGDIES